MKNRFKEITKALLIISLIIAYSCSNDTNQPDTIAEEESEIIVNERTRTTEEEAAQKECQEAIDNLSGTVCCTLGAFKISPGETLIYEHKSNYEIKTIEWRVVSGSITIVEAGDTSNPKLNFGNDFDGGEIYAFSESTEAGVSCSAGIIISVK